MATYFEHAGTSPIMKALLLFQVVYDCSDGRPEFQATLELLLVPKMVPECALKAPRVLMHALTGVAGHATG